MKIKSLGKRAATEDSHDCELGTEGLIVLIFFNCRMRHNVGMGHYKNIMIMP